MTYLFTGLYVLAIFAMIAAPAIGIDLALRRHRHRGLPPATAHQIRRAERGRRLRLGLH